MIFIITLFCGKLSCRRNEPQKRLSTAWKDNYELVIGLRSRENRSDHHGGSEDSSPRQAAANSHGVSVTCVTNDLTSSSSNPQGRGNTPWPAGLVPGCTHESRRVLLTTTTCRIETVAAHSRRRACSPARPACVAAAAPTNFFGFFLKGSIFVCL